MNKKVVWKQVSEMPKIPTRHAAGKKSVFLTGDNTESNITQVAYGWLEHGEITEEHNHSTMEEHFYFTKGEGIYNINGKDYLCKEGTFLKIPAGINHYLRSGPDNNLEFFYFGIALTP